MENTGETTKNQEASDVRSNTAPEKVLETPRTRTSITWLAIFSFFLILLLLIIFILQNQQQITIKFLGLTASLPMAIALLLAAISGAMLAGISAGARIMQLRLIAHRHKQQNRETA